MGTTHKRDDPGRDDDQGESPEFRLVLTLAEALRREFGDSVDAHPGGEGNEAGVVNRAFRAAVTVILGDTSPDEAPAAMLTWALRRAAQRRLDELGVSGPQAVSLTGMEPALGDRWLAYLALASADVVDDLMASGRDGPRDDETPSR